MFNVNQTVVIVSQQILSPKNNIGFVTNYAEPKHSNPSVISKMEYVEITAKERFKDKIVYHVKSCDSPDNQQIIECFIEPINFIFDPINNLSVEGLQVKNNKLWFEPNVFIIPDEKQVYSHYLMWKENKQHINSIQEHFKQLQKFIKMNSDELMYLNENHVLELKIIDDLMQQIIQRFKENNFKKYY